MRKTVPALVSTLALAAPATNAVAASIKATAPKKKVVTITKRVTGPAAEASRWGYVQVALVVKKTTTTVGKKTTVARKIAGVSIPQYPNHTDRSVFINQQALPLLQQETLHAQFTGSVDLISGATDTSDAFVQSLQSALLQAHKA